MNVGVLLIVVAKAFPYVPVPVGTKAIPTTEPDAQYKPGKGGQ